MRALTERDVRLQPGADVLGFDGRKVGVIVAVGADHVVVERGYLAPIRYHIPIGSVAGYEDGKVVLNVTKDAALNQGWAAAPAGARRERTAPSR